MLIKTIDVDSGVSSFDIGIRGENIAKRINFDITQLVDTYGDGTAVLLVKRPGDTDAYPVAVTRSENLVVWDVSSVDTARSGHGRVELFWYVGETLAKSLVYMVQITADIGTAGDAPPDPYADWVEVLTELGEKTLENAQAAQEAKNAAETAQGNAETAQDKAEDAQTAAEAAQSAAEASETASASSAIDASNSATLSESWAVGGTGIRTGEDTDNAHYWAELAQQGAEESGFVIFDVDDEDGHMYVTITANIAEDFSFMVNESTGHLEVTVNG